MAIKNKKQKKSKENFLAENFKRAFSDVGRFRNYAYFALFIFILFAIIGIVFQTPAEIEQQIKEVIRGLINKTEGLDSFGLIKFIFMNNFLVGLIGMISGLLFCFVPFIILASNGYVLGYVVKIAVADGGIFALWRLVPHGIFEVPAVMISLGMGLRLGVSVFSSLNNGSKKTLLDDIKSASRIIFFVILPLLIIAAIVEGMLIFFLK